jgi:pantothenate kinase type III
MRRLLGPLPYLMDLETRYRSRAAVFQFVRCERGDSSLLIGSDLIRECTGVKMKADNVHLLVDSVRAVVSDRFYNKAVFLGIRLTPAIGRDL